MDETSRAQERPGPVPTPREVWRALLFLLTGIGTAVLCWASLLLVPFVALLPEEGSPLRSVANHERRRVARVLGRPVPAPVAPAHRRVFVRSAAAWREAVWVIVHGFLGAVLPVLVTGLWLTVPLALSIPCWWWAVPKGTLSIFVPIRNWPEALALPLVYIALALLVLTPLTPGLARVQGWYAQLLLGPTRRGERATLAARVETLTETRAEAVEAHGAELRRIERDLHDGTQAQLVAAALRLGLADRKFADSPEDARALMLEARAGVENALTELRTVIRGIYPPILSDRGLAGAVRALAAGRAVPVSVDIPEPERRCPAAVEAAAYFVVAEALTNVSKHSGARHAEVSLRHVGQDLRVVVRDDGRGGARSGHGGSGLAGIRRRVAALDGVTRIRSSAREEGDLQGEDDEDGEGTAPGAEKGTTLEVRLPCGL
ncbi:signal transduction histidine kinase [Streptacidiphilus sp. MAP12-33]|uniref:sensor histidine kinase n=1 Tax=Streptacidiphilus sp. MAP12-33 TaxID=3156266 RepID=UPI0035139E43